MNKGRVSSGYQLNSLNAALNGISTPPTPHNSSAKAVATKPMTPNTRWPASNITSIDENINSPISS